uniref:Uncharacterized protein n=1 Tax=Ditylenchus dipsaci TaxID=166011 RepID=A0A915EL31_9BILA
MSTEEPTEQQQLHSNVEGVEKQGSPIKLPTSQESQPEIGRILKKTGIMFYRKTNRGTAVVFTKLFVIMVKSPFVKSQKSFQPNGTSMNNNSINSAAPVLEVSKATEEEGESQPTSENLPQDVVEPTSSPEKSAADGLNNTSNSNSTPEGNGDVAAPADVAMEEPKASDEPAVEPEVEVPAADVEPVCEKVEHAPLTHEEAKEEAKAEDDQTKEESSEKAAAAEEPKATGKRGLPKWMVEDAEDYKVEDSEPEPPKKSPNQEGSARGGRKGRGRGRAAIGAVALTPTKAAASTPSGNAGTSAREASPPSSRPRRSTRRIDYANPDSATVIAEVDDEEPGGLTSGRRGGGRGRAKGRAPASGKAKKRKAGADSSASEDNDEDGSSDYGSAKKKKRGPKGRRGRPAGSKSKTPKTKAAKPAASKGGRKGRKGKNADKDSDDEEGEVVYDDQESGHENEDSPMEEEEAVSAKQAVDSTTKAPAKSVEGRQLKLLQKASGRSWWRCSRRGKSTIRMSSLAINHQLDDLSDDSYEFMSENLSPTQCTVVEHRSLPLKPVYFDDDFRLNSCGWTRNTHEILICHALGEKFLLGSFFNAQNHTIGNLVEEDLPSKPLKQYGTTIFFLMIKIDLSKWILNTIKRYVFK